MIAFIQRIVFLAMAVTSVLSFQSPTGQQNRRLHSALFAVSTMPPPPVETILPAAAHSASIVNQSPLNAGVSNFLESPTMSVALQERKVPTQEEIEQKKMTFNVIFWGGGFVAPFLATIFYFGFKFWEK